MSTLNGARAIVRTSSGPPRSGVIERGGRLRIGRGERADLVVPGDGQMSAVHCLIEWDGESGVLRDLDSAKGTWLGGTRVQEARLSNGAWIRAGQTDFLVYFEAHSPAPRDAAHLVASLRSEKGAALAALRGLREPLFAIVDASTGTRALQLIAEAVDHHQSLYDGVKGDSLASVAPYLVELRADSGLLERLVREGWGRGWAIYLSCGRPFRDVRRHLRRFLVAQDDETLQKLYFRYYDPKTLRPFLSACTVRQLHDFFGEITHFVAEGESAETVCFRQPSAPRLQEIE